MTVAPRQLEIQTMIDDVNATRTVWPRIGWGLFLCILVSGCLIALGVGLTAWSALIAVIVLLVAWRVPYSVFYAAMFCAPFLSWIVSLSTGTVQIGERIFGGSIDIPASDVVVLVALAAWAFRLLFVWQKRRQKDWKPWLPLGISFGLLVLAHLASVLSLAQPNPILLVKYTLRPVLFAYVAWVLLPTNFLRSQRRLMATLGVLVSSGMIFALDGFRSLFVFDASLHRARPLPIFGVSPLGINHNVLAEWLVFTAPMALCLAELVKDKTLRRVFQVAALFMTAVALFTFARSAWITIVLQLACLGYFNYREKIKRHLRTIGLSLALLSPLAMYMAYFSSREEIQGSTDARATLSGIAWNLFKDNPWVGVGAGMFVDRVAATWQFAYEFGAPLDSHGILQKIAAETGLFGLAAFAFVVFVLVRWLGRAWLAFKVDSLERRAFACLVIGVIGAFSYQIFNTTYWTSKLWLPVGIALAGGRILLSRERASDPDFLITHGT